MATFSDMHTETLYYRAPSTNSTGARQFAAPQWGSAVSYLGIAETVDQRVLAEQGRHTALGWKIQTHTALARTYLLFAPGDDGSDTKTGRVPFDFKAMPLGPIGESGETLYEASL